MGDLPTRICASSEISTQALELPCRVTAEMEVERAMNASSHCVDLVLDIVLGDNVAADGARFSASFAGPHSRWRAVRQLTLADQLASAFPEFRLETA